jgi:hypothetical protein
MPTTVNSVTASKSFHVESLESRFIFSRTTLKAKTNNVIASDHRSSMFRFERFKLIQLFVHNASEENLQYYLDGKTLRRTINNDFVLFVRQTER